MKPYYEDDYVRIYHGDCREILPSVLKVDLILTDPPYGILGGSKSIGGSNIVKVNEYKIDWDDEPVAQDLLWQLRELSRDQVIWGFNHFAHWLPQTKSILIWDKKCQNGWNDTFSDAELAWMSRGKCRVYRHLWVGALRNGNRHGHPTEKPEELFRFCISLFPNAQTILDPFMGSGTTLRAAKDLNRKAIGIEIKERYCEIAAMRMAQEVLALAS